MTVYLHEVENTTPEAIRELIERTRENIKYERSKLPYADHGAYGQILETIRNYESRIYQLEHFAEKLEDELKVDAGITCPGNIRNDQY